MSDEITTLPELLRAAGYETFNASKDDYNFTYDRRDLYSIGNPPHPYSPGSRVVEVSAESIKEKPAIKGKGQGKGPNMGSWKGLGGKGSWQDVKQGPFFGQISIPGGKSIAKIEEELRARGIEPIDPADVRVPPQYPDIPQVRQHVTDHYNSILRTDHHVGELIQQFKDEVFGATRCSSFTVIMVKTCPEARSLYTRKDCKCHLLFQHPGWIYLSAAIELTW